MTSTDPTPAPLELHHLEAFVVLAEELNFTQAAARLQTSQQALSRRIAALEGRVGARLFDRTTRSVSLTEPGLAMLDAARRSLAASREAASAARRAGTPPELVCDISSGGIETGALVVRRMRQAHPDIPVREVEVGVAAAVQQIRSGTLDVALGLAPRDLTGLRSEALRSEPVLVGMHRDHPLAGQEWVPVEAMAEHPLLLPADEVAGEWTGYVAAVLAAAGGRVRRWPHTTHGSISAAEALRTGECVTPTAAWTDPPPDLVFRPLGSPVVRHRWSMVWAAGRPASAGLRAFLASARAVRKERRWLG